MDLKKKDEMAFDYAKESTKQLMNLATGAIALTITFMDQYMLVLSTISRILMIFFWVLLFVSIFSGQLCLHGLTGVLAARNQRGTTPNIYSDNIKIPSMIQIFSFLLAFLFIIIVASNILLFLCNAGNN